MNAGRIEWKRGVNIYSLAPTLLKMKLYYQCKPGLCWVFWFKPGLTVLSSLQHRIYCPVLLATELYEEWEASYLYRSPRGIMVRLLG